MMNPTQATNPPEDRDPWACAICGNDTYDETERENIAPICNECIKEWYTCPVCGEEFDHKGEASYELCDDCKDEKEATMPRLFENDNGAVIWNLPTCLIKGEDRFQIIIEGARIGSHPSLRGAIGLINRKAAKEVTA